MLALPLLPLLLLLLLLIVFFCSGFCHSGSGGAYIQ
jgi:hypothetical protein